MASQRLNRNPGKIIYESKGYISNFRALWIYVSFSLWLFYLLLFSKFTVLTNYTKAGYSSTWATLHLSYELVISMLTGTILAWYGLQSEFPSEESVLSRQAEHNLRLQRARSKAGLSHGQCSYCYRGNLYRLRSWDISWIETLHPLWSPLGEGETCYSHSSREEGSMELLSGSKRNLFTVVKLQNLGTFIWFSDSVIDVG